MILGETNNAHVRIQNYLLCAAIRHGYIMYAVTNAPTDAPLHLRPGIATKMSNNKIVLTGLCPTWKPWSGIPVSDDSAHTWEQEVECANMVSSGGPSLLGNLLLP